MLFLHCIIYALDTDGTLYFQLSGESSFRNELTENNIKIVLLTSLLSTLIFLAIFPHAQRWKRSCTECVTSVKYYLALQLYTFPMVQWLYYL